MELVSDFAVYKMMIHENRQKQGRIQSNFLYMSEIMRRYIDERRLYLQQSEKGLAFYVDEKKNYRLFFFWGKQKDFDEFRKDKPVLAELLEYSKTDQRNIMQMEKNLLAAGFVFLKRSIQAEMSIVEGLTESKQKLPEGFHIDFCRYGQYEEVLQLWKDNLDATDFPLDHYSWGKGERILCACDTDGKVVSVNWWKNSGRVSEGWHAVTHPDYYRLGLGSAILAAWCREAYREGMSRIRLWISDENQKSLAMCKKMGLVPNGRVSKQYLLQ